MKGTRDVFLLYVALALVIAAIVICGVERFIPAEPPASEERPTPAITMVRVTATPTLTRVPTPTFARLTSAPTAAPSPTASFSPTSTLSPTATATPSPVLTLIAEDCVVEQGEPYTIKPGDTLWDIADCAYGKPYQWPVIYLANPQLTDPGLIHSGNSLIIPHEGRWPWVD